MKEYFVEHFVLDTHMKKNKLVAIFGIKYEPQWLVDDLIENLKSWVDDFAILDCTKRDELWIHEGDYRIWGREEARKKGADWVFWTSPDERWEKNSGSIIRPYIDENTDEKILEFELKELYHPLWYRNDGMWDRKFRQRMFPLKDDQIMKYQPIQCHGVPIGSYEVVHLPVNIYHLKMIEAENRKMRAKVFNALDPDLKYQDIGYDYLDDEKEASLVRIPEERMYYPAYTKKYIFTVPEKYLVQEKGKEEVEEDEVHT